MPFRELSIPAKPSISKRLLKNESNFAVYNAALTNTVYQKGGKKNRRD
jgi:hypothetical protein